MQAPIRVSLFKEAGRHLVVATVDAENEPILHIPILMLDTTHSFISSANADSYS
jgi:hypothetical protein